MTDSNTGTRTVWIVLIFVMAGMAAVLWTGSRDGSWGEPGDRRAEAVARAEAFVLSDFERIMAEAASAAQALANDPVIIAGLVREASGEVDAVPSLVTAMAARPNGPHLAAEVYDPAPRLLAWNGSEMPMDAGPLNERFLSDPVFAVAHDVDRRTAVAVWLPVIDADRVVGAIRVLRNVALRVPVRNEYLNDYSLQDRWTRATRLAVSVSFTESGIGRPLRAPDGTVLGRFEVRPPTEADLARAGRDRRDGTLAFWVTLLLLSGMVWTARRAMHLRGLWIAVFVLWVGLSRFILIWLRVPARWQPGKAPLSPLFNPEHMASGWGGGLLASVGDLAVTALLAVAVALVVSTAARHARFEAISRWSRPARFITAGFIFGLGGGALFHGFATATRRTLLDSTLDYFARSGLLPEPLVIVVFGSLLMLVFAALLIAATFARSLLGMVGAEPRRPPKSRTARFGAALGMLSATGFLYAFSSGLGIGGWASLVLFLAVALTAAWAVPTSTLDLLTLRSVLFGVVLLALTLFPSLDQSLDARRRQSMQDAATSFTEERDPRVLFAVDEVIRAMDRELAPAGRAPSDSLLDAVLRGSLLASLGTYETSITVLDQGGQTLARTSVARSSASGSVADERDRLDLQTMQRMRADRGGDEPLIDELTSIRERGRFDYLGLDDAPEGRWVLIRASLHHHMPDGNTPFPRVLVPAGFYGSEFSELSVAEFRNGVLTRSIGRSFGKTYLEPDVVERLRSRQELWNRETIRDQGYLTYYLRRAVLGDPNSGRPGASVTVIAVRQASVNLFDRLYYLLRLTVAGLVIGLPLYLVGLVLRRRAGLLPAPRVRFRDRVLNAFFAVGLVAVTTMGALGMRVITGENERAIESWLRQHLEQVEGALALEARGEELPYRVLERIDVDSLAARVGLDLNVYRGTELDATSRPQLVRDRLISRRLPIDAYEALYVDGFQFVDVVERLGTFVYTAGYRALPDETGVPRYVVSVPTLPEQERIEEERARTVAYLFGALLLLVLSVMATAAVLANALARPVARLRRGLELVAKGRFERIRTLDTRDEMSDLVRSFNDMQDQLAESRRLLAQHERQLAWRQMAQQVAHEIKNPLTPMKLSVQHLQRAYSEGGLSAKFATLFERIGGSLIEQVDALAHIADAFSSYARMPLQKLEPLDLNEVIREAETLMKEHVRVQISVALSSEPLMVDADRSALRRMYINFIKNAVESIPEHRDGRIRLTSRTEEDLPTGLLWAVSEVADNGSGISEGLRDRIFNPSFSTKTSGTGLGLAIAKNTIEELRGRIGFETDEDVGTTFWVRIPLRED